MSREHPYLSVIIPAYNEENRIRKTLDGMLEYFSGKSYSVEILVVDDGSTDRTGEVVSSHGNSPVDIKLVSYRENRGKGYAIKTGMLKSRGEYAIFADADMSTPVEMFDRFEPYLEKSVDLIIGTRKTKGASIEKHQPFLRENMGKVFTLLSNKLFGLHVSDFTCGFKCFHRRTIEPIFGSQRVFGWGFDTELVVIARCRGFEIREVPVRWYNDEATRVRLLNNVFSCLGELFQIWNNNRKRLYG